MYKDSLILAKVMASSYMRVNLQGLIGCCAVWCVSSTPITQLSLHTHPTSSFRLGLSLQGSWSTNLEQLHAVLPVWQASLLTPQHNGLHHRDCDCSTLDHIT